MTILTRKQIEAIANHHRYDVDLGRWDGDELESLTPANSVTGVVNIDGRKVVVPDRYVRASDFAGKLGQANNPEWKTLAFDTSGNPVLPNGSIGFRWGEQLDEGAVGREFLRLKGCAGRLADVERPTHADNEATFEELQERIAGTVAFIESILPAQVDGSEEKAFSLTIGGRDLSFKGQAYLLNFVIPNVFFHCSTAYAILRHCGVELGKSDFIGSD